MELAELVLAAQTEIQPCMVLAVVLPHPAEVLGFRAL
jgi:hypothetical protein